MSGGPQGVTVPSNQTNTHRADIRHQSSLTNIYCPQYPNCGSPSPIPSQYPFQEIVSTSFSVVYGNPETFQITVDYRIGPSTVATSTDGGDVWSIVLLDGQTQYWSLEFIRDGNSLVSLMAQEVAGPNAPSNQRHALDAGKDAACAVAGAVGGAIGQTIGQIAGRRLGPTIGATIGAAVGPVGSVAGFAVGFAYGPPVGAFLGMSVGAGLATYACSQFYNPNQPTPAPTPIVAYNPGRTGGPEKPGLPPYDGGTGWTFPNSVAPDSTSPPSTGGQCWRRQAVEPNYWTRYAQDDSSGCTTGS